MQSSSSSVFFCLLSTHFPTRGVNPLWCILSGIRNSLCHHPVTINTHWCYDSVFYQIYPDLGFSFCQIWDRKTMDSGQWPEDTSRQKLFYSLNIRNVYWAAHYSLFGCRIFTLPKPIMWSRVFWQLRSLFSSLHLCQVIYQKESLALPPLESNVSYSVKSTADASC